MSKNTHSAEMHRLADAEAGTKVWYKQKILGAWKIVIQPRWKKDGYYIVNDEWADIRKAIVDGKTIEYKYSKSKWVDSTREVEELGSDARYTIEYYRIKPDVVEETFYYQYEKLDAGKIYASRHVSDYVATKELHYTEKRGWFKIESSKRIWEH